jgi:hypothetical protein
VGYFALLGCSKLFSLGILPYFGSILIKESFSGYTFIDKTLKEMEQF